MIKIHGVVQILTLGRHGIYNIVVPKRTRFYRCCPFTDKQL